jgi:hypothetical protein
LKNIWEEWTTMTGFETIICGEERVRVFLGEKGRMNPKPYDPNDGNNEQECEGFLPLDGHGKPQEIM